MARFGHYVTVHELRRTGLTVVYSGHDDKSHEDNFAIKVLESSVLFADKEREKIGINQFLNSARLQQKVVARGSQHWAPIYEYDSSPDGTFYVTDKYERSLQEMIDGHVAPSQKILHAIIKSMAEGLIELKKTYKRPHGNLKATNVLITGDFSEMKVALSDPLPDESIDAKVHWYADLRAIGELIYQLVVHRPAPSMVGARISDSKEWAGLKRQKDVWGNLCERLLAVHIRPDAITLENLVEELTELEKSKPVFSLRRLAVLSIILLSIGAAVAIYVYTRPLVTPKDWDVLCDDFLKWVEPFYSELKITEVQDDFDKNIKLKYWVDRDPNLENITGKGPGVENSMIWKAGFPGRLASAKGKGVEEIKKRYDLVDDIDDPNDYAEEADEAIYAVEYLRKFFDPNTTGDGSWPLLVEIHKAATSLEKNKENWLKPAPEYFKDLVENVKPPSITIVQRVDDILDLKKNDTLGEIKELQENINVYKSRWPQVYNDLLRDTGQYTIREVSKEIFENWLKQATGYREMTNEEDPRSGEEWSDTIENTEKVVKLIKTYKQDNTNELMKGLEDFKKEKEILFDIPRIVKKKDKIKQDVDQLNKTYSNLKAQIHDIWNEFVFNELQQGLDACYLLDDKLPQIKVAVHSLWKQWNEHKDPNSNPPTDLTDRINSLEQIEQINDRRELIRIAQNIDTYNEVAYAAWKRLRELRDSSWPNYYNDLTQDRIIRDRLKTEIIKLKNKPRSEYLLKDLVGTGLKYEIEFVKINSLGDQVLSKMVEYANKINRSDSLNARQELESLARGIANLLAGDDWRKINMTAFAEESDLYDNEVTIDTFKQWLDEVGDYKTLEEDPRIKYPWVDKILKIESKIQDEFKLSPQGDYLEELEEQNKDFNNTRDSIVYMNKLPLVEKYKKNIYMCGEHWKKLIETEKGLRPSYCRRLYYDNEHQLIFAEAIALRDKFEPVMDANSKPAEFSTWDEIRQEVNKHEGWIDFFYTTDVNDKINVGWPKYIRSIEDISVILRFIPAGKGNPEPFYMAIREISNAQYKKFLKYIETKKENRTYKLPNGEFLIRWYIDEPPNGIYWENFISDLESFPAVYVTHYGAETYADKWLGAQLPTVKQHWYAFSADSDNLPWSDQSQILTYAHVRAMPWHAAANKYNNKEELELLPIPIGAKDSDEDYYENEGRKLLKIDRIIVESGKSDPDLAWPTASATEANEWGLFDMIGNVWEWCRDKSICGGSCMAPPEYIPVSKDSVDNYSTTFEGQSEFDLGFRVMVLAIQRD